MTLSPRTIRLDLKCGKGAISEGEKCTKGAAQKVVEKVAPIALGLGLAAGAIALRRRAKQASSSTRERSIPKVPKTPPKPGTVSSPATREQARTMAQRVIQRNEQRTRRSPQQTVSSNSAAQGVAKSPTPRLEAPEGWRNVIRNEKHNYVLGKHPDTSAILGKSITPEGNTIDFKLGSGGEVEFRVNGDTNRRKTVSREEGATILTRVERMLQASIKDLPDDEYIWTNAYSNDGLGKKRQSLYERYGFKRDPSDPSSKELGATVGDIKKRSRRTDVAPDLHALSPRTIRLDLKCGKGAISEGEKCTKGPATKAAIAAGIGLTAGALALGAVAMSKRGRSRPSGATSPSPSSPSPQPRLPGSSPRALLKSAPPRQSKTQRMRANTAVAVRNAEGRIAQTAREEVRRIAQIGNTMAAAGEATGMAAKTTMRELRLRTEAARRRFEPGYRAPDQRRLPGGTRPPVNTQEEIPSLEQLGQLSTEELQSWVLKDPRTGQPRRRKPQGFGRTDNYIQHYAPVQLQPPTRRDACWEGYEQVGMKRKGKRKVPNCVPTARAQRDADDGKKYTKTVTDPETGRKNKVRYGAKGYKIAPGTDKGDRYCARSFGDMKSEGYDCSGAERNTPLCLSRAKWKCSGKTSRRS